MQWLEKIRVELSVKLPAKPLQGAGSVFLIIFYILLAVSKHEAKPDFCAMSDWIFIGIPIGIIELLCIWLHDTTITKYVRNLAGKKTDTVVMLSLIVVTWAVAGPFAAGYFFMGFLDNHFGEKQP